MLPRSLVRTWHWDQFSPNGEKTKLLVPSDKVSGMNVFGKPNVCRRLSAGAVVLFFFFPLAIP